MKSYTVTASARINAPAALVYSIIADYRDGHPHILPNPPFLGLEVEHGGVGAGTIITFQMRIYGTMQSFRASVAEPRPGQELVETNLEAGGATTTFIVAPIEQGQASEVSIMTEGTTARSGVFGALEEKLATLFLRRVYLRELGLLNELAQQRHASARAQALA